MVQLKNKACLVIGFFLCMGAYCQKQAKLDSLVFVYESGTYKKQEKLDLLKKITVGYNDPEKKLAFSELLIQSASEADSIGYVCVGYLQKGNAYSIKGELSMALENYLAGAAIAPLEQQKGTLNIAIADVYSIMGGNHNKVVEYYRKAIDILKNDRDSLRDEFHYKNIASALYNMGDEYVKVEKWDSALDYTREAQAMFSKDHDQVNEAFCLGSIGTVYSKMGKDKEAETYLDKAIGILQEAKEYSAICEFLGSMSDIYREKGDKGKAENYALKSYQLAKQYGLKEQLSDISLKLSQLYESDGDHQKALAYYKNFKLYGDSVRNIEAVNKMANMSADFKVSQKQKEVDLLETRNKLRVAERNGFIGASVLLLALLATGIYFYRQKVKRNKIIAAQKLELDQLNAAKDKLFSIVSHDLRSSVNALKTSNAKLSQSLATNEDDELQKQLTQNSAIANGTYNLLDNLLNWALLQTEQSYFRIEPLRLFFIVEQTAFNYKALMGDKNISFENNIARDISINADQESLKIILRNLFDNAIKFTGPNGAIAVYTRPTSDDQCQMVVEDSGQGMPETTRQELLKETILLSKKVNEDMIGTGLGMQLCKSLIRKNGGIFGIESEMGKGTRMIVTLPKTNING